MAEIIVLATAKKGPTKQSTYEHGGQRFTCTYDTNAPPGEQWVWHVDYVQTFRYVGSAPTMEKAAADARRKIHALNKFVATEEERR